MKDFAIAILLIVIFVVFFILKTSLAYQSAPATAPSQLHQEHLACNDAWQKYLANPTDENYRAQRWLCDGK